MRGSQVATASGEEGGRLAARLHFSALDLHRAQTFSRPAGGSCSWDLALERSQRKGRQAGPGRDLTTALDDRG